MALSKKQYRSTAQWKKMRLKILARDAYTCAYCGAPDANEVDHVWPKSKGGEDTWENLVACCRRCNILKKDKTDTVFLGSASTPPAFSFDISPIRTKRTNTDKSAQTFVKIDKDSPFSASDGSGARTE